MLEIYHSFSVNKGCFIDLPWHHLHMCQSLWNLAWSCKQLPERWEQLTAVLDWGKPKMNLTNPFRARLNGKEERFCCTFTYKKRCPESTNLFGKKSFFKCYCFRLRVNREHRFQWTRPVAVDALLFQIKVAWHQGTTTAEQHECHHLCWVCHPKQCGSAASILCGVAFVIFVKDRGNY